MRFLITFPSNAMNHIPEEEMPEVARAAHACCQELINAGVYVLTGGLEDEPASVVAPDGSVTEGANPNAVSGITIVDVPTRDEALKWAGKIAVACRCAQEVRQIAHDAELEVMLGNGDAESGREV